MGGGSPEFHFSEPPALRGRSRHPRPIRWLRILLSRKLSPRRAPDFVVVLSTVIKSPSTGGNFCCQYLPVLAKPMCAEPTGLAVRFYSTMSTRRLSAPLLCYFSWPALHLLLIPRFQKKESLSLGAASSEVGAPFWSSVLKLWRAACCPQTLEAHYFEFVLFLYSGRTPPVLHSDFSTNPQWNSK